MLLRTSCLLWAALCTCFSATLNAQTAHPDWKLQPKTGLYAVVSPKGKVLSDYRYASPMPFNRGIAIAMTGNQYRMVYANGSCSDSTFEALLPVQGGWFYGKKRGKWVITDEKGVTAFSLPFKYPDERDAAIWINGAEGTGLIDSLGNLLAAPKYQWISRYFNGLAVFSLNDDKKGLLDASGKEVLPASYDQIEPYEIVHYGYNNNRYQVPHYVKNLWRLRNGSQYGLYHKTAGITRPVNGGFFSMFSEDLAVYQNQAGKCGFIDSLGKIVIPAAYDACELFQNGLAQVLKKPNYGMINHQGVEVVPFQYRTINDFKDGYALGSFNQNHELHLIDAQGKIKRAPESYGNEEKAPDVDGESAASPKTTKSLNLPYGKVNDRVDGYSVVEKTIPFNDRYGAVDSLGKLVIPLQYEDLVHCGGGLFTYRRNKKWGLVNHKAEELTAALYDQHLLYTSDRSVGLLQVVQNGRYGCVDTHGSLKIPVKYTAIKEFKDGLAYASVDNLYGVIDVNGREIVPFRYAPGYYSRENDYFEFRRVSDKAMVYLFVNPNGKVSAEYDQAYNFSGAVAIVNRNKNRPVQWAALNRDGVEIVPLSENYVSHFSFNYLVIRDTANQYWLADKKTGAMVGKRYASLVQLYSYFPFYRVESDHHFGMLDTFGRALIPVEMDTIFYVNKWVVAKKSGLFALYDSLCAPMLPMEYEYLDHDVDGFFVTRKAGVWAFTPIGATRPEAAENGLTRVSSQGKWGWADSTGKVIIPCMFDATLPFRNGKAQVFLEAFGRPFRINTKGEFILEYYP